VGYPTLSITVPGYVDRALADSLDASCYADASDVSELQSLLTGGPGRAGQLTSTAWIFDPSDQLILLARHRALGWSNPGGHVEPGESPLDAAAREAFEETGLLVVCTSTSPVWMHARSIPRTTEGPTHVHWNLGYRFVADTTSTLAAESGQPVAWWPIDRLPDDRVDDLQQGVEHVLRQKR
jgi:8-oxo-dGTP diphosphatase